MLTVVEILKRSDKEKILNHFDSKKELWLASDIKSQLFILKKIKENKKAYEENNVLRAEDFWTLLLQKTEPDLHIVNRTALSLIYTQWAKRENSTWHTAPETGWILCEFISLISHVLHHPDKNSLMTEWIKKAGIPLEHWKKWYEPSSAFYDYLLKNNIIESSWAPARLLDKNIQITKWSSMIFDLGFDINPVETALVQQLALKNNVKVLAPLRWKNQAWQCGADHPYQALLKPQTIRNDKAPEKKFKISVKKFSTQLAEVKDITAQVKQALKTLKPSQISVLAPNIEDYWPCLKSHFSIEGIPVNKNETSSLISFPDTQLLLAEMHSHLSIIEYENLETTAYMRKQNPFPFQPLNQFKARHINAESIANLPPQLLKKEWIRNKNKTVEVKTFIDWTIKILKSQQTRSEQTRSEQTRSEQTQAELTQSEQTRSEQTTAQQKIKQCLLSLKHLKQIHLPFSSWLALFTSYLRDIEIPLTEEKEEGVHLLSCNALSWAGGDFIYLAGLNSESLKTDKHHFISSMEAELIHTDLGFIVKTVSTDKTEQSLLQFIQQEHKNMRLSFSAFDFQGRPLTPSALWLEYARQHKTEISSFDQPEFASWDKQQRNTNIINILKRNIEHLKYIEPALKEDKGLKPLEPFFSSHNKKPSVIQKLSPSSLKTYADCPFIFACEKMFKLPDEHEKDVDIHYMIIGRLVHKLFEKLNSLSVNTENISEQDILEIINQLVHSEFKKDFKNTHPLIIKKEQKYLLEKTRLFLKNEKKLKNIFKNLKTIGCEVQYDLRWNFKTAGLNTEGDIEITGIIDRVELDESNNTYFIIDYKSKFPSGKAAPNWKQQNNFQMGMYMLALEKGFTAHPAHPARAAEQASDLIKKNKINLVLPARSVAQALYLNYKDFSWAGFALKTDNRSEQLLNSSRSRSLTSQEKKSSILEAINQRINELITQIQSGCFPAKPFKESLCSTCRWRSVCRAAHLN